MFAVRRDLDEETARLVDQVEHDSTGVPQKEINTVLDKIGLPYSGINLSYSNGGPSAHRTQKFWFSLKPGHEATEQYVHRLREELPRISRELSSSSSLPTLSVRF